MTDEQKEVEELADKLAIKYRGHPDKYTNNQYLELSKFIIKEGYRKLPSKPSGGYFGTHCHICHEAVKDCHCAEMIKDLQNPESKTAYAKGWWDAMAKKGGLEKLDEEKAWDVTLDILIPYMDYVNQHPEDMPYGIPNAYTENGVNLLTSNFGRPKLETLDEKELSNYVYKYGADGGIVDKNDADFIASIISQEFGRPKSLSLEEIKKILFEVEILYHDDKNMTIDLITYHKEIAQALKNAIDNPKKSIEDNNPKHWENKSDQKQDEYYSQ